MPGRDGADAHVEDRVAAGGLALRPHSWTAVDGLPVEGWRAYVADRCDAAGVPYAFDVDLEHGVTAVVNPLEATGRHRDHRQDRRAAALDSRVRLTR